MNRNSDSGGNCSSEKTPSMVKEASKYGDNMATPNSSGCLSGCSAHRHSQCTEPRVGIRVLYLQTPAGRAPDAGLGVG